MWMKGKSVDRPCIRIQRGEIISISCKNMYERESEVETEGEIEGEREKEVSGWGLEGG